MNLISVVYKLYFEETPDKVYIGSASNFKKRLNEHFKGLLNKAHPNKFLQKDFNKYGVLGLRYKILYYKGKYENRKDLYIKETEFILKYKSNIEGYNIAISSVNDDDKIKSLGMIYDNNGMKEFIKNFVKKYKINIIKTRSRFLSSEQLRLTKYSISRMEKDEKIVLLKSIHSEMNNYIKFKNTALILNGFETLFEEFLNTRVYKKTLGSYLKTTKKINKRVNKILVCDSFKPFVMDTAFINSKNSCLYEVFSLFRNLNELTLDNEITIVLPGSLFDKFKNKIEEVISDD